MSFTHLKAAQDAIASLQSAVSIFEKDDTRSIYNIVPESMREAMEAIPPELLALSERQLCKEVQPDFKLDQLRSAFWVEYNRAQFTLTRINLSNVYGTICASSTFHESVIGVPKNLAWLLTPPTNWVAGMNAILDRGLQLLYDAVTATNIIKDGKIVDVKALSAVHKIIKEAGIVLHGLPVLKTESKSVNVNLNSSEPSATMLSLEEKRKELERLKDTLMTIPEKLAQKTDTDGGI